MTDINEFKMKKYMQKIVEIGNSTREIGYMFANAFYTLAYKVREYESQLKANERNNKLNW